MARPRKHPAPRYARRDAVHAVSLIRRYRERAGDPDVGLLPDERALDDDDVDAVLAYCQAHRAVDDEALDAELRPRAVLLAYREQQAERAARRRERELLVFLQQAAAGGRPSTWYAEPLGLSPQNTYNLRRALAARADDAPEAAVTPLSGWLAAHRDEVAEVGEMLVDQRPDVLALVADPAARARVAERVDQVGAELAPLPDVGFAQSVLAALREWWAAGPCTTDDPVLRDLDSRGRRLEATWREVTAVEAPAPPTAAR